jgi:hypothetical protein
MKNESRLRCHQHALSNANGVRDGEIICIYSISFCSRCVFPVCLISQLLNSGVACRECAEPQCLAMIPGGARARSCTLCVLTHRHVKVLLAARDCVTPPVRAPPLRCHEFVKLSSIFEFKLLIAPLFYYYARSLIPRVRVAAACIQADCQLFLPLFDRFFVWRFWKGNEICSLSAQSIICIILRK